MLRKLQTLGAAGLLTVVMTAGIAYAAPQAGDSLQSWYQTSYKQAVQRIELKLVKSFPDKLGQAAIQTVKAEKEAGISQIRDWQRQWLSAFNSEFDQRRESYNREIDEAQSELLGSQGQDGIVRQQFADYTAQAKQQADEQLELEAGDLLDGLFNPQGTAEILPDEH
ncbi:hypothetical protein AWM70_20295 [Paenibacillus yonginensis]|uniref:Uncharacterized protein n=2 Tax=Paenibacillus yonginensis TaxID=1462996 RepID=A0A1B1N5B2_9BACL|nr:hypothetical protein AWM70_20295 [Paenibacillus yonginensis]